MGEGDLGWAGIKGGLGTFGGEAEKGQVNRREGEDEQEEVELLLLFEKVVVVVVVEG